MKKFLLLASVAAFGAASMMASVNNPTEYPDYGFVGFSPNNQFAVSEVYGKVIIENLVTGDKYEYEDGFGTGTGNFISNTGVIVGQQGGAFAAWWQNGQWNEVNDQTAGNMSIASGITRDGTRMVGSIAPAGYDGSYEGLMLVPCYWDLQDDGTYGHTNYLPYPEKDLTGRVPQYITALCVSEDGKTIVGQVTDFAGSIYQPIVYTLGDNGEWSFTLIHNNLYHPEGIEIPEDPGDSPNVQPESFMSEEELAAYNKAVEDYYANQDSLMFPEIEDFMQPEKWDEYQAALDEYYETWENYPEYSDYMTEEELAAYNQAVEDYYAEQEKNVYPDYLDYMTPEEIEALEEAKKEMEEWDEKWMEFQEAYSRLQETVPSFVFNNMMLSPDGSTVATTYSKESFDFDTWEFSSTNQPWVFNLSDNGIKAYDDSDNLITCSMADDGMLVAQIPGSMETPAAMAYILPVGAEEFTPLYDYFLSSKPDIAAWMKENLTHNYIDYILNEDTWEFEEVEKEGMFTGIPFLSADGSLLSLTVENYWDFDEGINTYGYIIPMNWESGVEGVGADAICSVAGKIGGELTFKGEFTKATVYDMSGAAVFSVENPVETVATGVASGIYVVRAVAANGGVIVLKVVF